MSDYLWDKTGEPDAETERLEELLGQLRFQPTPFDLPAGLPAKKSRAAYTRNLLSWPRLALAASLTLAVLAGAWLMLKQQTAATNDAPEVAKQNVQPNTGNELSTGRAQAGTVAATENDASGEKKEGDAPVGAPSKGNETRRTKVGAGGQRPRVPDIDTPRRAPRVNRIETARAPERRKSLTPPTVDPVRREETARAEREAAEKVLYALRVTSEKLNYARQQVQEAGRDEANR